ncbi:MAG: flippase-like domain-containing protein [Cytophagaceae bacterium]|nr:flippase-like domain-containing protein [Gemmatimonadaceae bacterium]
MRKSDAPRRRAPWKHPAVRIGGSVAMLALLFWVLPFADIRAALVSLPVWVFGVAIATYLTLHLIGIAKWRVVVNAVGAGLPFAGAARAYYWGLFGNMFLPSIVGGDVVRMGMAMRTARSRTGLVLGSVVDRVLDIVGLASVAAIGAVLSPRALDPQSRRVLLGVIAVCVVGGLVGLAIAWFLPFGRLPFKVRRKLAPLWQAFRAARGNIPALVLAFLMSMSLQTLLVVMNWLLGIGMGIDVPLYVWLFVWPLAKISGLAPVTQGGIGVREAAQALLFAPFGVPAATAVAVGLVFEVVILSGGLIGGGIAWVMGQDERRRAMQGNAARA